MAKAIANHNQAASNLLQRCLASAYVLLIANRKQNYAPSPSLKGLTALRLCSSNALEPPTTT